MSLLLALAMVSQAQEAPLAAALRAIPQEFAGLRRHWDHDERPTDLLVAFNGSEPLDPLVIVALGEVRVQGDFQAARALAKAPDGLNIIKTMFEGRFAVPSKPGANSFFGEYLTEKGLWQVWLIEHGGVRTTVSTRILRTEDRRRMFDAVRDKLLGGATIIDDGQPGAANDRKARQ